MTDTDNYFNNYGDLLGYPKCCIKDFIRRYKYNIKVSRIQRRISNNTGFIPYSYCCWKVLTKKCSIKDLIENRKYNIPFPHAFK